MMKLNVEVPKPLISLIEEELKALTDALFEQRMHAGLVIHRRQQRKELDNNQKEALNKKGMRPS